MALTIGDLRKHLTSALEDPALQKLLDAAYESIAAKFGSAAVSTEVHRASGPLLMLNRPAASITTVTEDVSGTPLVLNALDYSLRASGSILERLATGPNPRSRWWGRVDVATVPRSDANERDRTAIDLVRNYLDFHPGVTSERIGDWQESFSGSDGTSGYAERREDILATLQGDPVGVY